MVSRLLKNTLYFTVFSFFLRNPWQIQEMFVPLSPEDLATMNNSVCGITKFNADYLAMSDNLLTHTHTHTHTLNKVLLSARCLDIRGGPRVSGLVFALTAGARHVLSFVKEFLLL